MTALRAFGNAQQAFPHIISLANRTLVDRGIPQSIRISCGVVNVGNLHKAHSPIKWLWLGYMLTRGNPFRYLLGGPDVHIPYICKRTLLNTGREPQKIPLNAAEGGQDLSSQYVLPAHCPEGKPCVPKRELRNRSKNEDCPDHSQ